MISRRMFLINLMLGLASCGGSDNGNASSNKPQKQNVSILFGLGDDPEKLVDGYDPKGKKVLDILKPNILNFWLNG
ncbi:MAG: hypothetical protein QXF15_03240, partial [Candidatus Aenigmatarchaeota archaeon]